MAEHGGDTSPFLPDEILTDILKRLPIKYLIRFQCVSKHWKNLLKSPSFIADHLHHPSGNQNQNPSSLLFEQRGADPLNLFGVDCEMRGLDVCITSKYRHAWIIGTCNGLMCIQSAYSFESLGSCLFLWNPATREVRRVPGVIHDDDKEGYPYLGFGFSPILNDYKIVRLFASPSDVITRVQVYSLNTDSWREIEFGNTLKGVRYFYSYASANGCIFWYVIKSPSDGGEGIVSFDTTMQVFTQVPVPLPVATAYNFRAIVHDKKLVLLCGTWMMVEDGVDDASGAKKWSWRKIDKSSPYLPNLFASQADVAILISNMGVAHTLLYIESLLPIVPQHSH